MANFTRQYTGERTAVILPSSDRLQQAQDNMNALIRSADEIRYKAFKENEKRFADMTDIDLETYLSTASANAQSKMLQGYNEVAAKILKKRGGRYEDLTPDDWQELNLGRKLLEAKQKNMQAAEQQYKTDKQIVERDPVRYNLQRFNEEKARPFLQTGEYQIGELPLNPLSFTSALSEANRFYQNEIALPVEIDKKAGVRRTVTQKRTEDQARQLIEDTIISNDRARTDILEKFDRLPESEKAYWLGQGKNGVIEWAKNNEEFLEVAKGTQYGNWASIPQPRATTSGYNKNMPVSGTNNLNDKYDIQKGTIHGKTKFESYLNLGQAETSAKTQQIQKYVDLDTGEEHTMNKGAYFRTIGYSPDKDMIIINLEKNVERADGQYVFKDKEIGLRGSQYDDFLRTRFGVDRESLLEKYKVDIPQYLKKQESSGIAWPTVKR